jgi:hypothetical protein
MKELFEVYCEYEEKSSIAIFEREHLAQKYIKLAHSPVFKYRKVIVLDSLPEVSADFSYGKTAYNAGYDTHSGEFVINPLNWFDIPQNISFGELSISNRGNNFKFNIYLIAENDEHCKEVLLNTVKKYLKNHPRMSAAIEMDRLIANKNK